jgi:hypothetical protein
MDNLPQDPWAPTYQPTRIYPLPVKVILFSLWAYLCTLITAAVAPRYLAAGHTREFVLLLPLLALLLVVCVTYWVYRGSDEYIRDPRIQYPGVFLPRASRLSTAVDDRREPVRVVGLHDPDAVGVVPRPMKNIVRELRAQHGWTQGVPGLRDRDAVRADHREQLPGRPPTRL